MTENSSILGFTIFQASCMGKASNCEYPHEIRVTDAESLKLAARRDYVCARYQNSYRSVANFMEADCVGMDVDNDHSDSPEDWIHPEDIRKVFPDVTLGVHYSRHHMKPKKNRTARPRYHVFLACRRAEDSEAYKQLKERLQRVFPYFDTNAQDAARFFFGTRDGACDFFPGTVTINECLDMYYPEDEDTGDPLELLDPANPIDNTIQEGHRNATLSHFAGRVLKRLGPTEEAHDLFLRRAAACDPPLEAEELEHIWRSAKGFYSRISQQAGYLSPEEYEKNNQRQYDPDDRTDVGQAELLRELAGERLRYSPNVGYLTYDGVCWEKSEQMAQGEAQTLTRLQLEEARAEMELTWDRCKEYGVDELLEQMPKRKAKECMNRDQLAVYEKYESATHYYEWAENRRSSKYIRATMQQVTSMVPIRTSELDADHLLLNCPDHSYDLRHGIREAREHRPGDYCIKVTSVEPSDEGMELWQDCLKKIFCGDDALIEYVQQICGLACVGKVFFEAMIIAYGDGRNGKSTFWNTIFRVMGTYAKTISAETLTTSCKRNTLPEMAELKGCRLVLASELKEGLSLNTSVVKQLTSTDPIHAEKKYFAPFDFQPTHTLVLYTNHLPKVRALDAGIWRRLIVVPFNARIEGKGDIKNYSDFLVEHAGGAVMKWILEGAQKVIAADYRIQEPEIVKTAIAEYRENNDWLRPFLDEKCDVDKTYREASGQFYMDLGYTEMPCAVVDIDKTREKALNIALNKISGEWDENLLAELLQDIQNSNYDAELTGFEGAEIDALYNKVYDKDVKEDNFDVETELKQPVFSKPGDLWLLGKHRVICGDSTKAGTYERLMDGDKANLVLTDPPYNVDVQETAGKIMNDNMGDQEFYNFLLAACQCMHQHLADDGSIYVWHADTEGLNFRKAFKDAGFYLSGCCIWKKNALVLGRSPYQWIHEPCLFGWKQKGRHQWYADRKQTTVWEYDKPKSSPDHPTMKPVTLMAYPIKNSTMTNGIILDGTARN